MQFKSLTVAAFILGLGVVAGCDDPEALSKAESVILYGATQAHISCKTNSQFTECGGQMNSHSNFQVTLFQDGSSFVRAYLPFGGAVNSARISQFNPRGEDVKVEHIEPNGLIKWTAEVVNGEYIIDGVCSGLNDSPFTKILDLTSNMTCTGFNLEAFE